MSEKNRFHETRQNVHLPQNITTANTFQEGPDYIINIVLFFFVVVVCLSDILRDTKRDFILIDEKKKKLGPEALTPSPGPELNWDCLPLSFFFFVLLLYLMQCLS